MFQIKANPTMICVLAGVGFFFPAFHRATAAEGPQPPANLRCEYLTDPVGIDATAPRFQWNLEHTKRGERQTGYQVLVADQIESLHLDRAAAWDSGHVPSADSAQIAYRGKALESGRTYYWKVRYWDNEGRASEYSPVARFEMGLLSSAEWKGKWITGNELRREFHVDGKVVRARAYVTALGYYELRINGGKVGDRVLDPAWTTFPKRVVYSSYDVTKSLAAGQNALAVTLGNGWATLGSKPYYPAPGVLLQVNIELEGGKTVSIASDGSWRSHAGPIVSNSVYDGEIYDARLETPGWDSPGFDDSSWTPPKIVAGTHGTVSAQMMPPIRVVDTLMPRRVTCPQPGVYLYDIGQNLSGWALLRVHGARGSKVTLRFAETTFPDGNINQENLRGAKAREVYILSGNGDEVYEPHFTYHGFRYIEVTGFPGTPTLESIRARVAHTDVGTIGNFAASTQTLNDIQRAIWWTQLTNLFSIPTDCDQRDERQGWMGDAQISAEEAMFNFDMAAFYTNFIRDIRDAQGDDGTLPETVPEKWGNRPADPAWGTAYPTIAWYMWQQYRDRRVLEENYEGIKKYVEDLRRRAAPDNVLRFNFNGDWLPTRPVSGEVISDAYYFYDVTILKNIAGILGKTSDQQEYAQLAAQIKDAFNHNFFNAKTREYGEGSQTENSMAVVLGLVPEKEMGGVEWNLVKDVEYYHNTHLTTGFIGTKFLMPALSEFGHGDLAYDLAVQTTYPSWGHMLGRGHTTIAEIWPDKGETYMYSHDHPALGAVGAWFYTALGGIKRGDHGEGYRHIVIAPVMAEGLQWASATTDTIQGTVSSSWSYTPQMTRLEVTIPVNSDAEIRLPENPKITEPVIREGGMVVWQKGKFVGQAEGISGGREEDGYFVFSVGSGRYVFELSADEEH